jgi:LysM repeat protein
MAAKKPTKPRKFKQARKDAKSAAKQAFSGKSQAGLKDRTLRISADDKEVASEVRKEAKGNYITDDRGNKIQVKPTETPQERMARDRREAKAQLQQKWDQEDGVARKPRESAPAKKTAPKGGGMNKTRTFIQATEVKPQGKVIKKKAAAKPTELGARRLEQMKKAGISEADAKKVLATNKPAYEKPEAKKPSVNKPAVKKGMTRAERSAANKAAWAKMTPAERKNWKGTKPAAATPDRIKITVDNKPTAPKPTAGAQALNEMGKKKGLKDPLGIEKKATPKSDSLKALQKKVGDSKKAAKPITKAAVAAKAAANKPSALAKVGKTALTVASFLPAGRAVKAGMLLKGALAGTKTAKVAKAVKTAESGKKASAANAARKAANAAKAEKAAKAGVKGKVKKVGLAAAGFYAIDKIPTGGGSKPAATPASTTRPQRPAGQYPKGGGKGLKLGPNVQVNAGGSTTSYTVKKGDTLSGIAKTSGVKLSEILAANPTIADKKSKYKGGSMIWSGTKVKLPTKK